MFSHKYLKNFLHFDFIYRSISKNPLSLPSIKKSSFSSSDISSSAKLLSKANTLKTLSFSGRPKIRLSPIASNEFLIKKGDPLSCTLTLNKKLTLPFVFSCSLAFSSISPSSVFLINSAQKVAVFHLHSFSNFFPLVYYENSLSIAPINLSCTFSIYFSKPLGSDSICLFSAFFPYYVSKKKVNNFRTILREIE